MTKEELITRMYEKFPQKKGYDLTAKLKKAVLTLVKKNLAIMINAPDLLIVEYSRAISEALSYCEKYLGKTFKLIEFDYDELNKVELCGDALDRKIIFSQNDYPSCIVNPYCKRYELRSDMSDVTCGCKFRLYIDGENPVGSAADHYESAAAKMFDRIICDAVSEEIFDDPSIKEEFEKLLSGEPTRWTSGGGW